MMVKSQPKAEISFIKNGDSFVKFLTYTCDSCGKKLPENDPHFIGDGRSMCYRCALLEGFCTEDEYLRNEVYWAPGPKYLEIEDGEIIVCAGKRRGKKEKDRRTSPEYKRWREKVFKRDNYTCQRCDARGIELNAHHVKPYKKHPELRLEKSNGITLCKSCHRLEHAKH